MMISLVALDAVRNVVYIYDDAVALDAVKIAVLLSKFRFQQVFTCVAPKP